MKPASLRVIAALSVTALATANISALKADVPYKWDAVPMGEGGYANGIVANRWGDIYIRSDMGGVFRWNDAGQRWDNLSDMFGSDRQPYYGVESIALDNVNRDILYSAVGAAGADQVDILRSCDRGQSWSSTGWSKGLGRIGANSDYRWAGERLAIDPNKHNIIYFGSRENGLWKNNDPTTKGNWKQVPLSSVPAGSGRISGDTRVGALNTVGVSFVAFDPGGGTNATGETKIIYTGCWGDGVFRSTDAGATWRHMDGSPQYPIKGMVSPLDGTLYVTEEYDSYQQGGAWYCPRGGTFAEAQGLLHPAGYAGLALHPTDPNIVMVAQHNAGQNNRIYRSTDGGKIFTEIKKQKKQIEPAWWPDNFWFARTDGLVIDPLNPDRVFTINWFGEWMTNDINANPSIWETATAGHEGSNPRIMMSPHAGEAQLFVGIGDASGFRYTDTEHYPERQLRLNTTDLNSFDAFPTNSDLIYAVGCNRGKKIGWLFRSYNNGKDWTRYDPVEIASLPHDFYGGRVAVSPSDPDNFVWMSIGNQTPYYTRDGGATWAPCNGIAKEAIISNSYSPTKQPLSSNKAGAASDFYIVTSNKAGAQFFRSADGGANFKEITNCGLPNARVNEWIVKGVPNEDGGVWVSLSDSGLFKSSDYGATFTKIPGVAAVTSFGFGKSNGKSPVAVYFVGRMAGDTQPENRVYRSDDMGRTWLRINDENHKFGLANGIEGDGQIYGKVYIATAGRGVFCGTDTTVAP